MPLTPLDIHNKEFSISFRGYNIDEVNDFLNEIIKDYDELLRTNEALKKRVAELEERLRHFENLEETLSKSIIVAQEAAEELKANARKEAELILKEAEKNANRIIDEALTKARKVQIEIEELKKRATVYRNRFRTLLEAQLEMLRSNDWDSLTDREGGDDGRALP
ncbi:MAG: DivIVA domain-containing protein [Hydrogenibacillus schlegelii]|uniref:DivIVA domain-containing protein n=1 Tax=Hydrogenibacillus schlegelii TaxID=1484 RepID=A0A947GAW2_HYDSH|nr:DivIVA domain-containing protein [Hydrogenibacillus schlegelii]MBT9281529.1 DivIVA domain-containing protein [Hydrogenibacillus schlegelii]